ncbi:MAG: methylated-DNA--[protein]-cysteine S-methyltransferase [Rhodospirillaceae bacterium]|nr:methylated-DNA--[protein]-cysteine S-methyltransferase [Rhodospirillaceae bacterium]
MDQNAMGAAEAPETAPDSRGEPGLAMVSRACRYIEARVGRAGEDGSGEGVGPVTLSELGRHCGMSPWHLQRVFKRVMGVTPRQYGDAHRLARLREGLQQGDGVAAATYDAGFGSSSRVYERSHAVLGMTPASYARGGKGARIAYAIAESPLGLLLVAATPRGVCFVSLGDDAHELEAALRREFPAADEIRRDDQELGSAVAKILRNLSGQEPHIDLPLDVRATAFQRRVWEELRRIPTGETRSYAAIARQIGHPSAQRAVGRACATNPVALVVPCHRVVRKDGAIGGFRWGVERKRALLGREAGRAVEKTRKNKE